MRHENVSTKSYTLAVLPNAKFPKNVTLLIDVMKPTDATLHGSRVLPPNGFLNEEIFIQGSTNKLHNEPLPSIVRKTF